MPQVNDGGPAFPRAQGEHEHGEATQEGMSLRDHYAGVSLPTAIAETGTWTHGSILDKGHKTWEAAAASMAYGFADAMLAERDRLAEREEPPEFRTYYDAQGGEHAEF